MPAHKTDKETTRAIFTATAYIYSLWFLAQGSAKAVPRQNQGGSGLFPVQKFCTMQALAAWPFGSLAHLLAVLLLVCMFGQL